MQVAAGREFDAHPSILAEERKCLQKLWQSLFPFPRYNIVLFFLFLFVMLLMTMADARFNVINNIIYEWNQSWEMGIDGMDC